MITANNEENQMAEFGGRSFEEGQWYLPAEPGRAKKARRFEAYKPGRGGIQPPWVLYQLRAYDGSLYRRSCSAQVWLKWVGESYNG